MNNLLPDLTSATTDASQHRWFISAAVLLSVRQSGVYEAVRSGRLPCVRVGRHVRFLRSDLERWVDEQHGPTGP
jgi:excisionase family DNA binding protein